LIYPKSSDKVSIVVGLAVTGAHVAPSTNKVRGAFPSRPRMGYAVYMANRGEEENRLMADS